MKNFLLILVVSVAALHATAQNTFSVSFDNHQLAQLVKTSGNDVVYAHTNTNYEGIWLTRISSSSTPKFTRLITDGSEPGKRSIITALIETYDKGLVIAGYENFSNIVQANTFLIKCDSAGNILWQTRFNDGNKYFEPADAVVCEAPDKSLYVAAGDRVYHHQLIKFSGSGQVLWHKRYEYHSNGVKYGYTGITADADNVYFSINAGACQECNYGYPEIYKVSKDGNVIWDKQLGIYNRIKNMKSLGNDVMNIVFYNYRFYNKAKYITGTFNLSKTAVTGNAVAHDIFSFVSYAKNKNLGYLQRSFITADPGNAYNYLVNDDWSVYAVSNFYFNKYDTKNRICPDFNTPVIDTVIKKITITITETNPVMLGDNKFTLTAPAYTSVKANLPFDVQCAGNAPNANADVASSLKLSAATFSISPNPVRDILTVSNNNISLKTIVVINASGKAVLKDAFTGKQKNINVSGLTAGIYYVRVIENNGNSQTVKLVKQ